MVQGAKLIHSEFRNCSIKRIKGDPSVGLSANSFFDCNLSGSSFNRGYIHETSFLRSNLSACSFRWTHIKRVLWEGVTLDKKTNFSEVNVEPNYNVINDKSERIKFKSWDRLTNWERIQFVSKIPVFEFSWVLFTLCLFVINSIKTLNETQYIKDAIQYPVPVPHQIELLLLSSLLLGIAALVYKIKCPPNVKNFTVSQWVYEHRHFRPRYLVETLAHEKWRWISVFLMIVGGGIGMWFVGERLWDAALYIFQN